MRSWVREHLGGRTTGTTPNDVFVGPVAGDAPGYLETGAEKRAEPDTGEGDETTTST